MGATRLIKYVKEKYAAIKFSQQQQILEDYVTWQDVRDYLNHTYRPKRGKAKKFNVRRACLHVARDYFLRDKLNKWIKDDEGDIAILINNNGLDRQTAERTYALSMISAEDIQRIRRAFDRATKRAAQGFYTSTMFLKMQIEQAKAMDSGHHGSR